MKRYTRLIDFVGLKEIKKLLILSWEIFYEA